MYRYIYTFFPRVILLFVFCLGPFLVLLIGYQALSLGLIQWCTGNGGLPRLESRSHECKAGAQPE